MTTTRRLGIAIVLSKNFITEGIPFKFWMEQDDSILGPKYFFKELSEDDRSGEE